MHHFMHNMHTPRATAMHISHKTQTVLYRSLDIKPNFYTTSCLLYL